MAGRSRGRRMWVRGAALVALLASAVATVPGTAAAGSPGLPGAPPLPHVTYFTPPTADARPVSIAVGPDGNLWFTESNANRIGRITPDGVITEFKLGSGQKQPYGIVAGEDGNLWFTERTNNKIGVMDTQGNLLHEYVAPGVDPLPSGITAGPDGNIWFTETGFGEDITDDIGRVTPDGFVTTFRLYECACFPIGITTGPDGNLWVTEEEGVFDGASPGTVDRVTPDGQTIDRFPIPVAENQPGHLPAFIAPGPDGNLWFTEFAADIHKLGQITTDGAIRETTLPGTVTNSIGVVTGPDGNLWVSQGDAGDILRLDTTGHVLQNIPTHPTPAMLTVGPDGNIWFASLLDNEIGRIEIRPKSYAYVVDIAPGFVPANRTVDLGTTVEWVLEAPGQHEVQDASGLGLFDSGPHPAVAFQTFRFTTAGTYPYTDPPTGDDGTIAVPPSAPPTGQAGLPFVVTWGVGSPAPSQVRDVQVRLPGSSTWQTWQLGVRAARGEYTPAVEGDYSFRARLRSGTSASSDWSPVVTVSVTPGG